MLWLSIVVLLAVAGTPLIAAVMFGRFRVCDADSHAECIRNWLSAMAGPLAIVAAFIAVIPVYEQLDEGRQATRAALAGLFKYEEDEKGGEMSALNEESEKVVKTTTDIIEYASVISKSISENKNVKNMTIDIKASKICIDTSTDLKRFLLSKKDGDRILPSRRVLAAYLKDLADVLAARPSSAVDDGSLVKKIENIGENIKSGLSIYKDEHEALNADIGKDQDNYRMRREQITSELSQNP